MKYIKRSFGQDVYDSIVNDFLEHSYKLIDISHKYEIEYMQLRDYLRNKFGTQELLKYRRLYRKEKYGETHHKLKCRKSSSVVPIVLALIDTDKPFNTIAQEHNVSRERVGQVAELCALHGKDVSREHYKNSRGSINKNK